MTRDWKQEAVRQWNGDPCGAAEALPFGSAEFFRAVERERYDDYAPWLKDEVGFRVYAGRRVLEVGCGLGTDHVQFARSGATCFGVDLTPVHLFATRKRLLLEGIPVRLVRGDAERLPFRSRAVDAVYSFGVLHHTPGTEEAVDEAWRVLEPGGEAIVGLYHRDSVVYWLGCVVRSGILRGGFWRVGYRKTLARVERRTQSDAVPLVKVYSRNSARRLFHRFSGVRISVRHFGYVHAGRLGRFLGRLLDAWQDRLARWFGWYVMIRARK